MGRREGSIEIALVKVVNIRLLKEKKTRRGRKGQEKGGERKGKGVSVLVWGGWACVVEQKKLRM